MKVQKPNRSVFDLKTLRRVVLDALDSVDNARQKCMAAGQKLNEVRADYEHGDWQKFISESIPEVSYDTVNIWMRAAANILKALPTQVVDVSSEVIPLSEILSTPDDELPETARAYKQQWLEFTADKTIKDCLNGVFVDGDEGHRVDRAVNGKTAAGAGGGGDRKAFPKFIALKLKHTTTFLSHKLTPTEQARIIASFDTSLEQWPRWLVEALADKCKSELKISDQDRAARRVQ